MNVGINQLPVARVQQVNQNLADNWVTFIDQDNCSS